ncbi:MAG: hypothetical protein LBQ50_04835 [Planctomycetaceae bacterium]|jgi:hypothetical protein|nr:hypothetical protein [Planctomycetaceae bacterium]
MQTEIVPSDTGTFIPFSCNGFFDLQTGTVCVPYVACPNNPSLEPQIIARLTGSKEQDSSENNLKHIGFDDLLGCCADCWESEEEFQTFLEISENGRFEFERPNPFVGIEQ